MVGAAASGARSRVGRAAVLAVAVALVLSGCVLKGSWTEHPFVPDGVGTPPMTDVSCPEVDACVAVGLRDAADAVLFVQRWDGASWTPVGGVPVAPADTDGWGGRPSLECWAADGCMVVVDLYDDLTVSPRVFVWDGTTWAHGGGLGEDDGLLDCWAPDGCLAVDGFAEDAKMWDGTSWEPVTALESRHVSGGTCVSATVCRMSGSWGGPHAVHLDGTVVSDHPTPFALRSITCASPSACHATSLDGSRLAEWDGTAWTERTLVHPQGQVLDIRDVACASADACVAVGFRTPTGGAKVPVALGWWGGGSWGRIEAPSSWLVPTGPNDVRVLLTVECVPDAQQCVVLSRTGPTPDQVSSFAYAW